MAVFDDETAVANAHLIGTHEHLSDVAVYRYLLIPTDHKEMSADKREAVAHIIDEQLTAYLRKTLKPKPNYQFQVDETGQVSELTDEQMAQLKKGYIDVHILSIAQVLRRHKLVCFDMDSTLIHQEVIVELARMAGVADKVDRITESAMHGEVDFNESFAKRVALLEGVDVSVVDEIIKNHISFSDGAFATIKALKSKGCRTVLISGGFTPFAKYVAQSLGMDEYHANSLLSADGKLTGKVDKYIIDGKAKARIVAHVADKMAIDMEEVVCVGDGANDLPMMAISDIGIAYKAKPIVRVKADASVNITGLEGVLYAMGHRFDKR
ncbi:phosphoserine phosphatase SerB [Moraxella lacunata]|uniref:phosphoserine phosphatase SerB n=1 Tax=Moraxella lacunata TaxID=477 RepID=UPI003EE402EF